MQVDGKLSAEFDRLQDPLELSDAQRGVLGAYLRTEGFALILRMWRDEVRKFTAVALNSNIADEKTSLVNLTKAKVAAQLYEGWVERLNHELAILSSQTNPVGTIDNPENSITIDELK